MAIAISAGPVPPVNTLSIDTLIEKLREAKEIHKLPGHAQVRVDDRMVTQVTIKPSLGHWMVVLRSD